MGLYDKPESFKPLHRFWIIGLGLLYAVYTALSWSVGYIDFGDGNYMYIGWRIAQGAVVYRDILAPQPPCHLFLGAGIVKLGQLLALLPVDAFRSPLATLYLFRTFSLLLHLASYALVLRLAWRAWGRPVTTVVAGAIWLWLPINFWWSLGYQSEPLEIFFLLAMMTAALRVTLAGDLLAGVFAALAGLTNATAAPFLLVLIIYMLLRAPLRALRMTAPCVLLAGAVVFVMQNWTAGAFWQNVFSNQAGSFPNESLGAFLSYAIGKLVGQGGGVMIQEGAFVILALIGLWRYLATSPLDSVSCAGLGWFFAATLGSIIYVIKGGTEDYIFNLAEPAVAILAAGELMAWVRRWTVPLPELRAGWIVRNVPFWTLKLAATLLLAAFALGFGLSFHYQMRTQQVYELPAEQTATVTVENPATGQVQQREVTIEPVDRIVHMIEKYSRPGERILSPPYYAFLARRPIWGDYSELFLWQMKYKNDRMEKNPEGEGWRKVRAMAAAIQGQQLPFIIMDMDQPGMLPEVMTALRQAYIPLNSPIVIPGEPAGYLVATRNTRLGFFTPLGEATPERQAVQNERWLAFQLDLLHYYGLDGVRKFAAWYDFNAVLRALAASAQPAPAPAPAQAAPTPAPASTPTPTPTPAPTKAAPLKPVLRSRVEPTSATLGSSAPRAQRAPATRTLNPPAPVATPAASATPTSPSLGGPLAHPALPTARPTSASTPAPARVPRPPAETRLTSAGQTIQNSNTPTSPTQARRRRPLRSKEDVRQFEQR